MADGFTPGPWQNNGIDLIDGGPRFGASLFTTQVGKPISDEEMFANALLIASAPDMFSALAAIEPYLDAIICYASTMSEHEPNKLALNVRAALAKARGESA